MDVMEKIHELEKRYGSQKAARKIMGVSSVCWWKWRNGHIVPSEMAKAFIDVLLNDSKAGKNDN